MAKTSDSKTLKSGEHGIWSKLPAIGTLTNDILLEKIQPPGKRILDGKEFLNGVRDWVD